MPHQLNVVLIEPEIPNNTGSIGRLCLATQSTLHLVDPLGFEINDTQLKRAGLDYWQHLDVVRHPGRNEFFASIPEGAPLAFFSKKAKTLYSEHRFQPGSYLIFGKETKGLSEELMQKYAGQTFRIPLYDTRVRSLNLSNAVSIVVYEAIRQLGM
ncbi:MAG: tRNA (cytidine(34)-2'-O)-methyltransferase [Nitrospinota bacterium]|nr:tRNA (cytidine(34)-2'-O)-methyltransferase [Nitrospinota bacterium]